MVAASQELGWGLIYFRKAAEKGLTESRYMIALSYFQGDGQIQNRRLAYEGTGKQRLKAMPIANTCCPLCYSTERT